jgi:hypothetical protein
MRYSVHIGREFQSVPAEVRGRLRWKLENISAVLEALGDDSPVMQSLAQSSLTITVGRWRFRYELDDRNSHLTVVQAMGGEDRRKAQSDSGRSQR